MAAVTLHPLPYHAAATATPEGHDPLTLFKPGLHGQSWLAARISGGDRVESFPPSLRHRLVVIS
jgi:hypothetical protein